MTNKYYHNNDDTKFELLDTTKFNPIPIKTKYCANCDHLVERSNYNVYYDKCFNCGNIINFFKPSITQQLIAQTPAKVIINIGGKGSGKTVGSAHHWVQHLRKIKNAHVIVCSNTLAQINTAVIPELIKFFHPDELEDPNVLYTKKADKIIKLNNGSTLEIKASTDPQTFKSANLTGLWLVEANNDKMYNILKEGITRLRNENAIIYQRDNYGNIIYQKDAYGIDKPKIIKNYACAIIEANPSQGSWVIEIVKQAHTIFHTQTVKNINNLKTQCKPKKIMDYFLGIKVNEDIIGILNSTMDNPFLPPDFMRGIASVIHDKNELDRELFCDLISSTGLVFEQQLKTLDKIFVPLNSSRECYIDENWVFIEGLDPGGSKNEKDLTNYFLAIFNRKTFELRILDGFQNKATPAYKDVEDIRYIRNKWYWNKQYHFISVADNQIVKGEKIANNYETLKHYLDTSLGVNWIPCSYKNIKNGIDRVKRWWDLGLIKINQHLDFAMNEIKNYTTATKKIVIKGTDAIKQETYFIDKNNHFLDSLRYVIVTLERQNYNPEVFNNQIYNEKINTNARIAQQLKQYNASDPNTAIGHYNENYYQALYRLFRSPEARKKILRSKNGYSTQMKLLGYRK